MSHRQGRSCFLPSVDNGCVISHTNRYDWCMALPVGHSIVELAQRDFDMYGDKRQRPTQDVVEEFAKRKQEGEALGHSYSSRSDSATHIRAACDNPKCDKAITVAKGLDGKVFYDNQGAGHIPCRR